MSISSFIGYNIRATDKYFIIERLPFSYYKSNIISSAQNDNFGTIWNLFTHLDLRMEIF